MTSLTNDNLLEILDLIRISFQNYCLVILYFAKINTQQLFFSHIDGKYPVRFVGNRGLCGKQINLICKNEGGGPATNSQSPDSGKPS